MAERQQVWVTWRDSKLLHKSRLRVDLLGGGLSRRQEEPRDGSTGNLGAHLAGIVALLWQLQQGSALPQTHRPIPRRIRAGTSLLLSC